MTNLSHVCADVILAAGSAHAHLSIASIFAYVKIIAAQWMAAFAELFLGIGCALLIGTVAHVVALSSHSKMIWVEAGRIVASMPHYLFGAKRETVPDERRESVEANHVAADIDAPVSGRITSALPFPTTAS